MEHSPKALRNEEDTVIVNSTSDSLRTGLVFVSPISPSRPTVNYLSIVTDEMRSMYETLIREYPELEDQAAFKTNGVGISFTPVDNTKKWRSLEEVYQSYLADMMSRKEVLSYNNLIHTFILE